MQTWEKLGYVERVVHNGKYRLGIKSIELSRKVAGRNRIAEQSRGTLIRLHEQFNESVYLGVYRKGRVVLIDAFDSTRPLRVVVDLGGECYLHASALGRAVAAFLSEESLNRRLAETGLPKITGKTNADLSALRKILAEIRTRGYAINREETVEGAVCVGAPFFAGPAGVLGAIALSTPTARATDQAVDIAAQALREAAYNLTEQLRGTPTEPDTVMRESIPGFWSNAETVGP